METIAEQAMKSVIGSQMHQDSPSLEVEHHHWEMKEPPPRETHSQTERMEIERLTILCNRLEAERNVLIEVKNSLLDRLFQVLQ